MCARSRHLLAKPPVDAWDLAVQAAFPITVSLTCVVGALLFIGMSRRPIPLSQVSCVSMCTELNAPRLVCSSAEGVMIGLVRAAFVWYARWKRLLFIPDAAALTREPPSQ